MSQGMQDARNVGADARNVGALQAPPLAGPPFGYPQPNILQGIRTSPIITAGTNQRARGTVQDSGVNLQTPIAYGREALGTQQIPTMNHMASPMRPEGGNMNGFEVLPQATNSPAAVSALTGDSIGMLQTEARGYFIDRWVDSDGLYRQMDHLFKGAIEKVIHKTKFLDHEEVWEQPDFVTWLKCLENGQSAGVKNVPIPIFLTRHVFQNWVGSAHNKVSNDFDLENLETICHFWRHHNKTIKKRFLNKRSNLNGAVKIVFVKSKCHLNDISQTY